MFTVLKSILILIKNELFIKDLVNINFIGDIHLLPKNLQKLIKESKQKLKGDRLKINLAIAYDYNKDIQNFKIINSNYRRNQSNIDLVFRSGGEKRLSGFFPTKTIY